VEFWNETFPRFTLFEWAVALLVFLIIARFFWAEEAGRFVDGLFESVGLGGGAKYSIAAPLGAWVLYRMYKRKQAKAAQEGKVVVRPQVLIIFFGLLALAIALLIKP
jgi:hypothetical protein